MSDTIRSKAHVKIQDMPLRMGPLDAHVEVADAEFLPNPGASAIDLKDGTPNVKLHAARLGVSSGKLKDAVAEATKDSGSNVHLALKGQDRFELSGTYQSTIPFKVQGQLSAASGKLAFTPETADLSAMGASIRLDMLHQQAKAVVPNAVLEASLAEAKVLEDPKLSWTGPQHLALDTRFVSGKPPIPLHVEAEASVQPSGKLRLTLEPMKLKFDQVDVRFDLGKQQATASVPGSLLQKKLQEVLSPLEHPRLSWKDSNTAELKASLPLRGAAPLAALVGPKVPVTATVDLVPMGQQLGIKLQDLALQAPGVGMTLRPGEAKAHVALSNEVMFKALAAADLGPLKLKSLDWKDSATLHLGGDLAGNQVDLQAVLMPPTKRRLALQIQSLSLLQGKERIGMQVAPSGMVTATLTAANLQALAQANAPLKNVAITLEPGNRVKVRAQTKVNGIDVPVQISGKLDLTSNGQIALKIERAYNVNLGGRLKDMGLTLERLLPDAPWKSGGTLLIPFELPQGVKLSSLATTAHGTVEAKIQGMELKLPDGVRFDGNTIEMDVEKMTGLPATVSKVSGGAEGLNLDLDLDRAKLRKVVTTALLTPAPSAKPAKPQVVFDGQTFLVPLETLAGSPIPGKLVGVAGGSEGIEGQLNVDDSVLKGLKDLPSGIQYEAGHFDIDPKLGKDLPGTLASVVGGPDGMVLGFKASPTDLQKLWTSTSPGLAWDGQALTVDPEGFAPGLGAKVTRAVIKDDDLVLDLSDGTAMPTTGGKVVRMENQGRVTVGGVILDDAKVEIRPKAGDLPWDLAHLDKGAIKLSGGKVTVPPAMLDEVFKKTLEKDYDVYKPRIEDGMLVVDAPMPMHLKFSKTSDGKLSLVPERVGSNSSEWGLLDSVLSSVLTPLAWAASAAGMMNFDLKAKSGMDLPPLKDVSYTAEGLVLDFGTP